MKILSLVLYICFFMTACSQWDLDTEWKSGPFRLIAIDSDSQMSLIHEDSPLSLVGPTIFSIGSDERYIILKQHPAVDDVAREFDRSITYYYIIERDKTIRGPLKKYEFDRLAISLSFPPFTKTFDHLK